MQIKEKTIYKIMGYWDDDTTATKKQLQSIIKEYEKNGYKRI